MPRRAAAVRGPRRRPEPLTVPAPGWASRPPRLAKRPRERGCGVAAITGAHGVRGLVKVKSFTDDPAAFADYGPLEDNDGRRRFNLAVKSSVKGQFLVEIEGVSDRDAAAALTGTTLWVDRDRLPPPDEDAFYHADLIGLPVVLADGTPLGTVRALYDFGAGDVMEVGRPGTAPVVLPFTKAAVAGCRHRPAPGGGRSPRPASWSRSGRRSAATMPTRPAPRTEPMADPVWTAKSADAVPRRCSPGRSASALPARRCSAATGR